MSSVPLHVKVTFKAKEVYMNKIKDHLTHFRHKKHNVSY